jgi:hypothetical protein
MGELSALKCKFCTERKTQMEPHLESMMAMRRETSMGILVVARMGIG